MNIALIIGFMIGGMVIIPALLWYVFWEFSFKYPAMIARQVGRDPGDVIWFRDRCKVRVRNGQHIIIFRRQIDKSQSFNGEFWTKMFKNKSIKFTDEKWDQLEMSNKLKRGIFLHQGVEGEFRPLQIQNVDGKPTMVSLSQDNRNFLINAVMDSQELTLNKRQQFFLYGSIVLGFVILGVAFVLFLVYSSEVAQDMCNNVPAAVNTFVETAQGAVGG